MPPVVRNRRQPWDLTEDDVTAALARIRERDDDFGREAAHVYDTLTWGEGPAQIRRAGVQEWLWYQLPTKYLTDEAGYMGRLAVTAAVLFDELALDGYAAVCRSEVTAGVHAAFERSDPEGFKAMRKAMKGSGIEPPDLDDFVWGEVMGMDEALARTAVEHALETAIARQRASVRTVRTRVLSASIPTASGSATEVDKGPPSVSRSSTPMPTAGRRSASASPGTSVVTTDPIERRRVRVIGTWG